MVALPARISAKIDWPACGWGCWLWTGARYSFGYGATWYEKRVQAAHRVLYAILREPLKHEAHHVCGVPECVNPWHIVDLTSKEHHAAHIKEGVHGSITNAAKTHCPHGHPYSEENTYLWRDVRFCRACHYKRSRAWRLKNSAR